MRRGLLDYRPFPDEQARNSRQESLEVPALVRALSVPRRGRILEVGCGRGVALPVISRLCQPAQLVGMDNDHELLAEALIHVREAATPCELVCADVRKMPFADDSFDVVVDFGTLYHISRPHDALVEIARVLTPSGLLVHETKLSQLLSHPVRSLGRSIPWATAPYLRRKRWALLWATRTA